MAEKSEKVSFKETLNLPQTSFPIRPNAKETDPELIKRWEEEKLFEKSFYVNEGAPKFILHDGPPYANGHIHLGTAYNKIIKDFIGKSQRMLGKQVPITPGWDCHGLPIELKVTHEQPGLDREQLQKACRAYAEKWIKIQREEFKQLGVLMNWDHPYLTMDFSYEAWTIRAFGLFVHKGYIERKNKTVPWCPSCQTVLASAEIEYQERKDPSIYVQFPLTDEAKQALVPALKDKDVSLLVWTTTPWTLPLNRAVMLKPDASYVVLDLDGSLVIVGEQRAGALCTMLEKDKKVVAQFSSEQLKNTELFVHHPFIDITVPLVSHEGVSLQDGTACVHCAPGAGPEDYEVGVKNKLEIFSPVGPDGVYTQAVHPAELVGKSIADGQGLVIKMLVENGRLLHKTSLRHSFPHCWRCRGPLLFRATKQWFCDLEKHNLRAKTISAIQEHLTAIPEKSRNRLTATMEGRLEWCLSRQRVWGTPIPALICKQCDHAYATPELINTVADGVAKEGIEFWDKVDIKSLLPQGYVCERCQTGQFRKEYDILDVWFDSGISHYAVLERFEQLKFPADIYAEGKDQHRGWFQSSVLTSMVIEGSLCTRSILTLGFVVDGKGQKMSKSLGNVVQPQEMIEKLGTDGLRLWAASVDAGSDPVVSEVLLRNVQEVYRKVRNTCRFLLSNLYDFNIKADAVPLTKLSTIDQFALRELYELQQDILANYQAYDFTAIFHRLGDYCAVNLSSFYLDIIKDRLYVSKADGYERRSAQTACWYILDTLTHLVAPILSFTAEQISDLYQKDKTESIHLQPFSSLSAIKKELMEPIVEPVASDGSKSIEALHTVHDIQFRAWFVERWDLIKSLRSALLKAIEEQREKGLVKHSLEAKVTLFIEPGSDIAPILKPFFAELKARGENAQQFFKELLVVSQFIIAENKEGLKPLDVIGYDAGESGLYVAVLHAEGQKCPRCWQWELTDNKLGLCSRCAAIV